MASGKIDHANRPIPAIAVIDETRGSATKTTSLRLKNWVFVIFCMIIIIVAFSLMGTVIYAVGEYKEGNTCFSSSMSSFCLQKHLNKHYFWLGKKHGTEAPPTQNIESIATCSKNSYMLNDGQCDDEVNTPECLYDLGDCCKENKEDSIFCKKCECVLEGKSFGDHTILWP